MSDNQIIRGLVARIAELEARVLKGSQSTGTTKRTYNPLTGALEAEPAAPSSGGSSATTLTTSQIKTMVAKAAETAVWESISGDGKPDSNSTQNNVFMQNAQPDVTLCSDGDIWIDTDDNNHLYRFDEATETFVSARDGLILDMANDGIITPLEKLSAKLEWDTIVEEGNATDGLLVVKADALGKSHSTFDSAYAALDTYLNTTLTVFSDMDANTTVTRATWDSTWKAYYDARTALVNSFVGAVGGLNLVTGNYMDLNPVVVATIGTANLTAIFSKLQGFFGSAVDWMTFVGTEDGKVYMADDPWGSSFSLVYNTGNSSEKITDFTYFDVDGRFYATTDGGTGYGRVLRSSAYSGPSWDTTPWEVAYTSSYASLNCIEQDGTTMVVGTGGDGAGAHILSTTNGTSYTDRLTAAGYEIFSIKHDGVGVFVGTTGGGGTDRVYSSTTGLSWTSRVSTATTLLNKPVTHYIDPRTGLSTFLVPYSDGSNIAGARVGIGGTSWSTEVIDDMSYTDFSFLTWQGTAFAFGNTQYDSIKKRVFDTTGVAFWERRLVSQSAWNCSGKWINAHDRILWVSGSDNKVYSLSQFQMVIF